MSDDPVVIRASGLHKRFTDAALDVHVLQCVDLVVTRPLRDAGTGGQPHQQGADHGDARLHGAPPPAGSW